MHRRLSGRRQDAPDTVEAVINPETCAVGLVDGYKYPAESPTKAMGVPKLDLLSNAVAGVWTVLSSCWGRP